ncbi:hypothetical protein Scep_014733 [Stephania cephalantha]|uniref:Uncharacterized protein n=1 Tax=Stephania cephalantha TaxID=152367 RepID=A0AAP0NZP5_9MAGN
MHDARGGRPIPRDGGGGETALAAIAQVAMVVDAAAKARAGREDLQRTARARTQDGADADGGSTPASECNGEVQIWRQRPQTANAGEQASAPRR